ncbi:hypothetical protein FOMPIDRAFT_1032516 [Fomitopsis schrenkii]|uniref:gluconokinase n=1 Tax=Fomitopsis schrenkii TaxID=2126942 RepID=S8F384_FOMSC|nr:hypothetical protein FOMPIDRAFT_1032516 [Fomitopsis schrenkii]
MAYGRPSTYAATGKTTGDELHHHANIDKMSNGQLLTNADREFWLALLRTTAEHIVAEEEQKGKPQLHQAKGIEVPSSAKQDAPLDALRRRMGAVVTCSALRKYCDILRGNLWPDLSEPLHKIEPPPLPEQLPTYFIFMKGDRETLLDRVKASMVDSQLATLEDPEGEEDVIPISIEQSTEEQMRIVLGGLNRLTGGL